MIDEILKSIGFVRYSKYVADIRKTKSIALDEGRESTQDFLYEQIANQGGRCIIETRPKETPRMRIVGKA